ncbi:Sec-independent protein translocase protein TatD (deoxyribonuclease) [Andalucia godoyi]|uniref:Sec-independent protein translocase protein TatD (Deoxyribonuclease) n=1 Tax=Andalucia godoyi TaxID=505711 RepID=A0A8K0F2E0_ANDGO|nr:Sec-independent protein translocase protein TatD (deoxyribonuclease) [Andalucia godoyi]|eukprot:ANDGO_03432.mRNA.1 Sec-independent protein translocase protein TatD (deoxyribonuclease)
MERDEMMMKRGGKRFIDIGANLTDCMFAGVYNSKQAHPADVSHVLRRAVSAGADRIVITAGRLSDTLEALAMIERCSTEQPPSSSSSPPSSSLSSPPSGEKQEACEPRLDEELRVQMWTTVGVHPTRARLGESECVRIAGFLKGLRDLGEQDWRLEKIAAIGEVGLDYDRVEFASKEEQSHVLRSILSAVVPYMPGKPLFLHARGDGCVADLLEILTEHADLFRQHNITTGVVHSFDGSAADARQVVEFQPLHLMIGVNGCSLRTEENLAVLREHVPISRLLLETDAPWCDIRPTHASAKLLAASAANRALTAKQGEQEPQVQPEDTHLSTTLAAGFEVRKKEKWSAHCCVKGRNEPAMIVTVAAVLAELYSIPFDDLATHCERNTLLWLRNPQP